MFRYRRPSLKTALGVIRVKRQMKRSVGISQVEGWTKPSRVKQKLKLKYRAGLVLARRSGDSADGQGKAANALRAVRQEEVIRVAGDEARFGLRSYTFAHPDDLREGCDDRANLHDWPLHTSDR